MKAVSTAGLSRRRCAVAARGSDTCGYPILDAGYEILDKKGSREKHLTRRMLIFASPIRLSRRSPRITLPSFADSLNPEPRTLISY
jgi:hypothetical protein